MVKQQAVNLQDVGSNPTSPANHKPTYICIGMIDQIKCSCGWESDKYFDGMDLAEEEFERHKCAQDQIVLLKLKLEVLLKHPM